MKKLAAVIVVLGAMMALMAGPAAATGKVTLCHLADGPAQAGLITVDKAAAYNGHYLQHSADVIPPFNFDGAEYSLNWTGSFPEVCGGEPPPPPPELVQVCDPATGDIIVVPEDEADQYLPVDDPACDDEPPPPDKGVKVCDPKTGKIIRVDEDMADQYLPVNDPACKKKTPPPPCAGGSCTPDPPPPPKCEEGHVSGDQNKACDSLPFTGAHWFEGNGFKAGLSGLLGSLLLASGLALRRKGQL